MSANRDVTLLLDALTRGEAVAAEGLFPLVYDELRRLAQSALRSERGNHTLQATTLVHEAYVKFVGQNATGWRTRAEFFAVAAQAMRRILVDHARTRKRDKRGGGVPAASLNDAMGLYEERALDLTALDGALTRLANVDPRKARLVELRFFGGMTMEDAANLLDVPLRTAERDWTAARAWLREELKEAGL